MENSTVIDLVRHPWKEILGIVNSNQNLKALAIIDNFLDFRLANSLQKQLIDHWGWFYRHPTKPHLTNNFVHDIEEVNILAKEIQMVLNNLGANISICNIVSLRNNNNSQGVLHADNFDYTLTLWLTPSESNLDKFTGGIRVFDVERPKELMKEELEGRYWCEDYLRKNTHGSYVDVEYKFNRAVFFKPRTLHQTHKVNFDNSSPYNNRINLTFGINKN